MPYDYKKTQELAWFIFVAVATVLMQALMEFDPAAIVDGGAWAVSLGAASVRAAAGAALAFLTKPK